MQPERQKGKKIVLRLFFIDDYFNESNKMAFNKFASKAFEDWLRIGRRLRWGRRTSNKRFCEPFFQCPKHQFQKFASKMWTVLPKTKIVQLSNIRACNKASNLFRDNIVIERNKQKKLRKKIKNKFLFSVSINKKKVPQQKKWLHEKWKWPHDFFQLFEKKKESKQFFADRRNKKKRFTNATRDF